MSTKEVCDYIDDKTDELNEKLDLILKKFGLEQENTYNDSEIDEKISLEDEQGVM